MVSTPAVAVLEIVRALGISLRHPAGASNGGHPASSGSHHLLRGIGGWEWAPCMQGVSTHVQLEELV